MKVSRFLLSFLFLISLNGFAKEKTTKELEAEILADFDSLKESGIIEIFSPANKEQADVKNFFDLKFDESRGEIVLLKKGGTLFDLNEKEYRLSADIYAYVAPSFKDSSIYTVFDKTKKKHLYYIHYSKIVFLGQDLDLKSKPDQYVTYLKKSKEESFDTSLNFKNMLWYKRDTMTTDYYNRLFVKDGQESVRLHRLESAMFFDSRFFIDLGFYGAYEKGDWQSSAVSGANSLMWDALFFGPAIEISHTLSEIMTLSLISSFSKSYRYNASYMSDTYVFDASSFDLALNCGIKFKKDRILLGLGYRYVGMSLKDAPTLKINSTHDQSISAIGVNIGYQFDWSL